MWKDDRGYLAGDIQFPEGCPSESPSLCFLSSPLTRRHTLSFEVSPGVISNPLSPHLQVHESVSSIPPFLLPTDQSCHGLSIPIVVVSAQPRRHGSSGPSTLVSKQLPSRISPPQPVCPTAAWLGF